MGKLPTRHLSWQKKKKEKKVQLKINKNSLKVFCLQLLRLMLQNKWQNEFFNYFIEGQNTKNVKRIKISIVSKYL